MCKKLIYLISVLVLALCLMSSAQAANITLVTEDHDFDEDGIQDDQQLVDWLVAEGHVVDVQRDYWTSFGRTTAAELNAADLIIVSRTTSSGNYDDEDEPTKWNSLTVPLILMSAYPVRSSHWKWVDSASVLGEGGAPMLEAVDPGHPIFTNVPLDASNQVQIVDGAVGSGHTSFIDVADVGNGTLIAQTVDGLPWIAEWGPGVEYYNGSVEVPAGTRMMFFAGTQEPPIYGAWNFTAEGEILFRNAISYMLGERIAPIVPPPPALVAHWKFDDGEGTVAVDSSGNGNDGILNGDPQWVEGKIGGALEFNGDDYVNCGNGPSLQLQDAITMAFWFKVEAFQNTWEGFMAKGDDSYRTSRGGGTGDATHMGISGTSVGGGNGWFNGTVIVTDNQWHHMAATYDGAEGRIYIDGVLDVTSPGTGQINISNYDLYIGENSQATGRFFHGLLDDVRIYDGALTEEQIQAVMTPTIEPVDPGTEGLLAAYEFETDATDGSGNGNDGAFLGDAHVADGVLVLDGDGDAVAIPRIGGADATFSQLTYSMMVYPTVDQTPLQFSGGLNTNDWNSGAVHIKLNYGNINVGINGLAGGDLVGTTIVLPDMWSHMVLTVSETEVALYLNGVLEDSRALEAPLTNLIVGGGVIGGWAHPDVDRELTGMMDDVLIYDRALSEAEIRYLAGERATPVDPGTNGLVAYYPLENDVLDASGNELHGTIVGEPAYVEGPAGYGMAMAFDGVDDYIDFGNDARFDITEQVSLAVWVNANDMLNGEHNPWLGKGDHCYAIKHQSGNYLEFFIYDGGWHSTVFRDYDESMNGEWHHTAGTYDGSELKFYLDGELSATLIHEGSIESREHPVTMGTNSEAGGRFYDGVLDEGVIYNRALSAGEVRYLAGFRPMVDPGTDNLIAYYPLDIDTLDASGNGNDGTVNGDPIFVDGVVGTAMEFDGAGDFLDCGNNPILALTDAVSISAWIKVAVQNADHKVGGNQDGANGGYKMSVYNNKIEFEIRTSGNSAVLNRSVAGGTLLEVDVWYHVTGVYSLADGYIRTYVNGVLDRELETTEALGASPGALMIGCEPFSTGQYNFNGVMDDIRVYDKALSEDEARYLANN